MTQEEEKALSARPEDRSVLSSHFVFGVVRDQDARRVEVVLAADTSADEVSRIKQRVDADQHQPGLAVSCRRSSRTVAEHRAARDFIMNGVWRSAPEATPGPMSVAYLPSRDVFEVSLEEAARPAGELLQAALAETVVIAYGGMGRAARGLGRGPKVGDGLKAPQGQ